jgi:20S proteasome alpha/beta subunit
MIIQSPELLEYKKMDAKKRIDKYLLLLLAFKNGLISGVKFNERQSKPGQWLLKINSNVILAGIGDLRDFHSASLAVSNFCQNMAGVLGTHYLTGNGIINYLTGLLNRYFIETARAFALNFIIADCRNKNDPSLCFIDFDGSVKPLKNFAVAGGNDYQKHLTKEEFEKLLPEEKAFLNAQKKSLLEMGIPEEIPLTPTRLRQPKKEAIAYLEKNWKPNMRKEEAVELIKKCFLECNPESHDKMIEIIAIEYGKEPEPLYFKKTAKDWVQIPSEKILRK